LKTHSRSLSPSFLAVRPYFCVLFISSAALMLYRFTSSL
jgi:hypothetical protein